MQTNAPAGVAITSAFVSPYEIYDLNDNMGWGGGSYYAGGGSGWQGNDADESDSGFSSSYWGFQMICGWSSCGNYGGVFLNSIELIANEDQGPGLTAVGSNNL
jgi:outer membrane receptor for monomeric catechols